MIKELEQTPSTNSWAKEHAGELTHGDIVVTRHQTAGRGQRGNSWEAAPGKNLTFSLFLTPQNILPARQFVISEIVALGVVAAVRRALAEAVESDLVKVKWPNDVYVGDRKIGGILIEHSLQGNRIGHTVAGIGLNVNQQTFQSDAPNPVSLIQLTHRELHLPSLLMDIHAQIITRLEAAEAALEDCERIHKEFLANLWRNDGTYHIFSTPDGSQFQATIVDVAPDGPIMLRCKESGQTKSYFFKEVAFVV